MGKTKENSCKKHSNGNHLIDLAIKIAPDLYKGLPENVAKQIMNEINSEFLFGIRTLTQKR